MEEYDHDDWKLLHLDFRNDIVEDVFKFLDFDTLKSFRLVSKSWNQEALRVLAVRGKVTCSKGSIISLYATLQTTTNCQYLFTSFDITFTSPLNRTLQKILETFGHHLRKLRCSGDLCQLNPSSLVPAYHANNLMLFKSNRTIFVETYSRILQQWCPNLESIRIFASTLSNMCSSDDVGNCPVMTVQQYFFTNVQLNLTRLELDGFAISRHKSYCISLIKACQKLTRLKISFGWNGKSTWEKDSAALEFFLELKYETKITRNLVEFQFIGLKINGLMEIISSIKFSSDKLEHFSISGSTNISDPEFIHTVTLLEKLAYFSKLKILKIYKCTCLHCEWRNWKEKFRWRDIEAEVPNMSYVRLLEISSYGSYGVGSVAIIQRFPRLEVLKITLNEVGHSCYSINRGEDNPNFFDYFFQDWTWLRLDQQSKVVENGRHLQRLTVQHTLFKLASLNCIRECFPNLTHLTLTIRSNVRYCWEVFMECKMSLPTALETLSKLEKLEVLSLKMDDNILYPRKETMRGLRVLKEFPKLRIFSLVLAKSVYSRLEKRIMNEMPIFGDKLAKVLHCLNITIDGFCCCKIGKDEISELKTILASFKNNYQLKWCCLTAQSVSEVGTNFIRVVPVLS